MAREQNDFTAYVERSNVRLLRAAYLLVGELGAAEDLLQDVYERLYVAWPRVSTPDAYAHRALANAATSRWRRRSRRPEVPLDVEPSESHPSADHGLEQRDIVMRALAALPLKMRAVVVLRFLEDLSEAETAAALGCSVGTVKSQSSRGLDRLRDELARAESGLTRNPLTPRRQV